MRRPSANDGLVRADRALAAAMDPGERVALALALGRESLRLYATARGLPDAAARREVERRRQARRRASRCVDALLA